MTSTVRATARRLLRVVVTGALAGGALIGLPEAAFAHDQLVASDPADGAQLSSPPAAIRLTFNEEVLTIDPQVVVRDGSGATVASGTPEVSRNTVSLALDPLPAGSYRAAWRVVSADGHPVEGAVSFTIAGASGGSTRGPVSGASSASGAALPASPSSTAASAASSSASAPPIVFGILIVILVIGAGVTVVLLRRRAGGKEPE